MREFFRGWRRKVGCVALVMACVIMGLWFRTHFVEDVILSGNGKGTIISVQLSRSGLLLNRYEGVVMKPGVKWWREGPVKDQIGPPRAFFTREKVTFTRQSQWYVFGSGEIQNDLGNTMSFWVLPFWSIIVPLTLLSAYLILWKPRKRESRPPQSQDTGAANGRALCNCLRDGVWRVLAGRDLEFRGLDI